MSVRQLLDRIEKMNVVEDRILKRIRRQIDDPEKNIKAKGIPVSYTHLTLPTKA